MLKAEPSPRASTSFSFSFLRPSKTTVPVASLLPLRGFGIMETLNKDIGLNIWDNFYNSVTYIEYYINIAR
jgi:hypothetical protein